MSWEQSLRTLRQQFEARAATSRGLHHLMVEAADNERDRLSGPGWFRRECELGRQDADLMHNPKPWTCFSYGQLPLVSPSLQAVEADEPLDGMTEKDIVRDDTGRPRAVFTPMRLRFSYLCGDPSAVAGFRSLATTASRILLGCTNWSGHPFADDLADLFRPPRSIVRYTFGTVPEQPSHPICQAWQAGVLAFPDGVLIDLPVSDSAPDGDHWLLLLHRLSWRRIRGSPLQAGRMAWKENTTFPYELVSGESPPPHIPQEVLDQFAGASTTSFFSHLGDKESPLDVNLASAFAIDLLLDPPQPGPRSATTPRPEAQRGVSQPPKLASGKASDVKRQHKPKVVLLVATQTELVAVLSRMTPLPGADSVLRTPHANNTFYAGHLGGRVTVVCMCGMGAVGRDAAGTVTGELIRFWKPSALIMVGICFGRDPQKQRLGQVLVSESVIPYEPQRVGTDKIVPRGHPLMAGPRLLNRFRNALVDWRFIGPDGGHVPASVGSIVSGEKLVDDSSAKAALFTAHPAAIGGEMEGAGVATAAERERCEWILVKGICDWADGNKGDDAQPFAAAAAVSLVEHVLSQPDAV